MATYSYIDKNGQNQFVQANDPNEALRLAPNIAPHSGVALETSAPGGSTVNVKNPATDMYSSGSLATPATQRSFSSGDNSIEAIANRLQTGVTNPEPNNTSSVIYNDPSTGQSFAVQDRNHDGKIDEYDFSLEMSAASNPNFQPTRVVNSVDTAAITKKYGLTGTNADFSGMTQQQAEAKAQQMQSEKAGQTSSLTSYSYSPDTVAGAKKASDAFILKLNDITNSPWMGVESKQYAVNTQLAVTSSELSKNWTDSASFLKDFTQNPDIQKNLESFLNAGGTKEQIIADITKNNQPDMSNVDQTTADYINNLSAAEKAGMQKAAESLMPEVKTAQEQIAQQVGILKEYRDLYFGTPDQVGLIEKQMIEASAQKALLIQKENDAKTSLTEKANLLKEKNNADAQIALSTIEKNRLSAKNYMTGMLAKLGALNTTSAAGDAITTLDEKYQAQAAETQSKLNYANQTLDMNLTSDINDVTNNADTKILSIEQDLSKSGTDMIKEVMKEKQAADKAISAITSKYQALFRTQTDKYTKDAQAKADAYTKEFAKTVSSGLDLNNISSAIAGGNLSEGEYVVSGKVKGVVLPDGTIKPLSLTPTQANQVQVAKVVGEDTIKYFVTLPAAFKQMWQQRVDAVKDPSVRYSLKAVQSAYEEFLKGKKA